MFAQIQPCWIRNMGHPKIKCKTAEWNRSAWRELGALGKTIRKPTGKSEASQYHVGCLYNFM